MTARARYEYVYTVVGVGNFPIDMLRYDVATPATESDSERIARSINERVRPSNEPEWFIKLRSERAPTEARWASFEWRVGTNIEKRRVA